VGDLKYRKKIATTLPIEMVVELKKLSETTKIPLSRLHEIAIENLFVKFKNDKQKT
jgi:hypothetical protein